MARFDVYENSTPLTRAEVPYLLDVQADLLDNLATRVVVPLVKLSARGKAAKHLNPQFSINKEKLVMPTAELAGIPVTAIGEKLAVARSSRARSAPPWISFCRVHEMPFPLTVPTVALYMVVRITKPAATKQSEFSNWFTIRNH